MSHLAGSAQGAQTSTEKTGKPSSPPEAAGVGSRSSLQSGADDIFAWDGSLAVSVIDISVDGQGTKLQYWNHSKEAHTIGAGAAPKLGWNEYGPLKIDDLQAVPAVGRNHVRIICSTRCTGKPQFKQLFQYFVPNAEEILLATDKAVSDSSFHDSFLPHPYAFEQALSDCSLSRYAFLLPTFCNIYGPEWGVPQLLSLVAIHSDSSTIVFCEVASVLRSMIDDAGVVALLRKRLMSSNSFSSASDGSRFQMLPLILLDVFEVVVDCGLRYLKRFKPDISNGDKCPEWRAHVSRSLKYHRLLEWASDLGELILAVQHLAGHANINSSMNTGGKSTDFEYRSRHLELIKTIKRRIEREDHKFLLYKDTLNIEETQGVARLTLLATIFLPLSLAASILSMQTRLADLRWLLYDFFGGFFIITTIALFAFPIITKVFNYLARQERDPKKLLQGFDYKEWHTKGSVSTLPKYRFLGTIYLICVGLMILASFLVGMVKDTTLGLKILGYGFATVFGLLFVAMVPVSIAALVYVRSLITDFFGILSRKDRYQWGEDISADIERRHKAVEKALLTALSE